MSAAPDEPACIERVASRGVGIEVISWGDVSAAPLVLVAAHGFLDSAAFSGPLVEELRARMPVAVRAMSFAGHGGSGWADVYRWYDHVRDVLTVVSDTRQRNPGAIVVPMGHSFGAVQVLDAVRWLVPAPPAVINLDAVSGPSGAPDGTVNSLAGTVPLVGSDSRALPVYPTLDALVDRRRKFNPRLGQSVLTRLVPSLARPVSGGWTWRVDPALVGWTRPWQLGWTEAPNPVDLMREVDIPILLITGRAKDHPQVRGAYPGDATLDRLDGVRQMRLLSAGHYVHIEAAAEVADAMARFLCGVLR